MSKSNPTAGGFFLILPILIGFGGGLAVGRAVEGAMLGLAVGILLALIIWARDRRPG